MTDQIDLSPYVDQFPTKGSVRTFHCKSGSRNNSFYLTYMEDTGYVIGLRSDFAGVGPAVNVSSNHPLLLMTNNTERMRISSGGALVLQEGNPIYTDTLRNDSHNVGTSDTTILDFSTAGTGLVSIALT